jgi:glyceraldehyde-3-phosphate dehydrogenase/erythrose-4-phosphate dehydrogenase
MKVRHKQPLRDKLKETKMTVRFAILGAGRIGQVHARAVAGTPGAKLIAIADPVAAAAESVKAAYGCDIRAIDAILASADVDAVVICTPTDTHADLIEKFTAAGKARRSVAGSRSGLPEGCGGQQRQGHGRLQPPL